MIEFDIILNGLVFRVLPKNTNFASLQIQRRLLNNYQINLNSKQNGKINNKTRFAAYGDE